MQYNIKSVSQSGTFSWIMQWLQRNDRWISIGSPEKIKWTLKDMYVNAMKDELTRRIVQIIQHVTIISRWQRQSFTLSVLFATSTNLITIAVASVNCFVKTRGKKTKNQHEMNKAISQTNRISCVLSLLFICFTHLILTPFHYFISFHTIHLN